MLTKPGDTASISPAHPASPDPAPATGAGFFSCHSQLQPTHAYRTKAHLDHSRSTLQSTSRSKKIQGAASFRYRLPVKNSEPPAYHEPIHNHIPEQNPAPANASNARHTASNRVKSCTGPDGPDATQHQIHPAFTTRCVSSPEKNPARSPYKPTTATQPTPQKPQPKYRTATPIYDSPHRKSRRRSTPSDSPKDKFTTPLSSQATAFYPLQTKISEPIHRAAAITSDHILAKNPEPTHLVHPLPNQNPQLKWPTNGDPIFKNPT